MAPRADQARTLGAVDRDRIAALLEGLGRPRQRVEREGGRHLEARGIARVEGCGGARALGSHLGAVGRLPGRRPERGRVEGRVGQRDREAHEGRDRTRERGDDRRPGLGVGGPDERTRLREARPEVRLGGVSGGESAEVLERQDRVLAAHLMSVRRRLEIEYVRRKQSIQGGEEGLLRIRARVARHQRVEIEHPFAIVALSEVRAVHQDRAERTPEAHVQALGQHMRAGGYWSVELAIDHRLERGRRRRHGSARRK
jgi:hypothetical protein